MNDLYRKYILSPEETDKSDFSNHDKVSKQNDESKIFFDNKKILDGGHVEILGSNEKTETQENIEDSADVYEKISNEIKSSYTKIRKLIEDVNEYKEEITKKDDVFVKNKRKFEIIQNEIGEDLFVVDNKVVDENYFVTELNKETH